MHTFKKLPIHVPSEKARKGQVNVGKVITSFPNALPLNKIYEFCKKFKVVSVFSDSLGMVQSFNRFCWTRSR